MFVSVCCIRRCYCRLCSQRNRVFGDLYFHRGLLLLCMLPVLPPSFARNSDGFAAGKPAARDDNADVDHPADAAVSSTRELHPAPIRLCSASYAISKLSAAASSVSSSSSARQAFCTSTSQRLRDCQVLIRNSAFSVGVFIG